MTTELSELQRDALIEIFNIVTSILPSSQHAENTLLSKADGALYQTRQKGRNCVVVYGEHPQG